MDGLHYWSLTNPVLSGITVDDVAVQWGLSDTTGGGFTQATTIQRLCIL